MMLNDYNTKVTVELRDIVESGVKLWDFDYPSYYKGDEKTAFEQKVIDHYYFRQIGQETVGRFLHMFRAKVREIMPYYIQRYESVALFKSIADPLQSYDLKEEFTRQTMSNGSTLNTGTETETSSATGSATEDAAVNRERRFSDTPHGSIDNLESYMSEASRESETTDTERTNTESGNRSSTVNASAETADEGSETYTLTRKGNIGVQPLGQEINVLRSSFINVDMEIIDELKDLFLKVY